MSFNYNNDGTRSGIILPVTPLNGLPITTPDFNVRGVRNLGIGWDFKYGSGTLTRLDFRLEASFGDEDWLVVTVNPDKQTGQDVGLVTGLLQRTVGAADDSWTYTLDVSGYETMRIVCEAGAGAGAADDTLHIHLHGEP